jgi:hypothetical protein
MYTTSVDAQHPLPQPSWQASASCVSTSSSPVSTPPPQPLLLLRQRLAGWSHMMVCPLAMDHTHIRPGKNPERNAKGVCLLIAGFGPVGRGGEGRAPAPLAPQPVSALRVSAPLPDKPEHRWTSTPHIAGVALPSRKQGIRGILPTMFSAGATKRHGVGDCSKKLGLPS